MTAKRASSQWSASLLLAAILAVAFALRLWGIRFGLPYLYHYDEHFYVNTALKLGTGVLHNPPYAATGLSNVLFAEYAVYYLIGKATGLFASVQQFEAAFRSDPTVFYLLGRGTSALLGTGAVFALYWLGRAIGSPVSGLVASGFLAVSFLYVRDAHYAVPDIGMAALVVTAVALAAWGLRTHRRRLVYLAGLIGGLAIGMKWTALPVAAPVWYAALCLPDKAPATLTRRLLSRTSWVSVLFLVLGFVLGSPQILLNLDPYLREALGQYGAGQAGGFEIWQVDTVPGWLFYGKTLLYGVGLPLLALGSAGVLRRVALAVKGGDQLSILVVSFPLAYYLLMGATRHYFARYAIPLIPCLALFAGEVVVTAGAWLSNRYGRLGYALAGLLTIAAIFQPLASSIRHDWLLTQEDTRTIAKRWIEQNIPAGAKIAVDWPVHGPPLATQERAARSAANTYNVLEVGGTGLAGHPLSWYREQEFDYLIASSFIADIPLVFPEQDAARRAFYASLGQELMLVQEFRPTNRPDEPPFIFDEIYGPAVSLWQRERPGPTLKVYRVQ